MGMFSEIATEGTIQAFVRQLKIDLKATENPEAREALKKIGRFALTQFEYSVPEWAAEYQKLFEVTEGPRTKGRFSCSRTAVVDCEDIPAAIVTVRNGEPLVLLVSAETLEAFEAMQKDLGYTHVALANYLRDIICEGGGQFHENAIAFHLRKYL